MLLPQAPEPFATPDAEQAETQTGNPIALWLAGGVLIPAVLAYALASGNPFQVLVVIVGLLCLAGILARPFWGLIVFLALIYIRPEDVFPALAGMRITLIISVVTLCGVWLQLFVKREKAVRTPFISMILGFALMTVLSTVAGGNPIDAFLDNSKLVILVLLVLNLVTTPQRYTVFRNAVLVFTAYLAVSAIYLYFTGSFMADSGTDRATGAGLFSNPNDLACAIVPGIGLAILGFIQTRKLTRILYAGLIGLIVWCIMLTNSRGGMLGMLVVSAGFIIAFQRNKLKAAVMAAMVAFLFLTVSHGRIVNFDNKEGSANSRIGFWGNAVMQLVRHPLTGVGYLQFPNVNDGMNAHNTFVICFAELGLPGYFFWIGCLYYCFCRRSRNGADTERQEPDKRELLGARLALASYLVPAFFGNYTYIPITYVLMALPVAQQIATSQRAPHYTLTPDQKRIDIWRILALAVGSILLIKFIIPYIL